MKYYKRSTNVALSNTEAKAVLEVLEQIPMITIAENSNLVRAAMKIKDHFVNLTSK
jgi:predicted nucleic acid-binding protein